jgi:hypothetical protein
MKIMDDATISLNITVILAAKIYAQKVKFNFLHFVYVIMLYRSWLAQYSVMFIEYESLENEETPFWSI